MFVIGLIPKGVPDVESAALGSRFFRGRLTANIYYLLSAADGMPCA